MSGKHLLLALLGVAALLAAFNAAAGAHSRPIRFDPAPGAVLDAAPSSITGWFTSELRRADESFIQVLDAAGLRVDSGEIELSSDRLQMSVGLNDGIADGGYIVHWSTFDDGDGEVFSGCYVFYVGQSAAAAGLEDRLALDGGALCPAVVEEGHGDEEMASDASIAISVETNGSNATLTIEPSNFTPRAPDGTTVDPSFGHYHIYLDKVPVDALSGGHGHDDMDTHDDEEMEDGAMSDDEDADGDEHANGLVENPVMWVENTYEFTDLEPGVHTVSVLLNHDDHTPFSPLVIASESFTIGGTGAGNDDDGVPVWTLFLTGGIGVAGLAVGAYSLSRKAA